MGKGILNSYSDVAFINIVKSSDSYKDCARKLGYKSCTGDVTKLIKQRIDKLNIDTSHFYSSKGEKRNLENVFCENSTAYGTVLRRWYEKGEYTPYVCAICGQKPFWNGKEMSLILDHINGKNRDNRLSNLRWVCPNCNIQLETSNGKNQVRKNRISYYCCDCGQKLKNKKSTRCASCESKRRKKLSIVNENDNTYSFPKSNKLVERNELKQLIRTKSFIDIGKYYGVSDNSIRKWCKTLGLPYRHVDIHNISDEDWENI